MSDHSFSSHLQPTALRESTSLQVVLRKVPRCHKQHWSQAYMEPSLSKVQNRDSESNAAGSLLSAYREIREEVVEAPQPIVVMMGHVVDCF